MGNSSSHNGYLEIRPNQQGYTTFGEESFKTIKEPEPYLPPGFVPMANISTPVNEAVSKNPLH